MTELTGSPFNLPPYLPPRLDHLPPADDRRYPPGGLSPTVSQP